MVQAAQWTEPSMPQLTTIGWEVPTTARGDQLGGATPTMETRTTTRERLGTTEACCVICVCKLIYYRVSL